MTYQVSEDGITIDISDEVSVSPDKTTPSPDDEGAIKYYELLDLKDSKSILWREKLGEGLKNHLKDVTIPKAILVDFPQGYKLYAHRKKYPKKGERTDVYLFGHHRFRSSNEFLPHLIWLISDKSGQCCCKYCYKSNTNRSVSFTRKAKRQRDVDTTDETSKSKRITRSSSVKKYAGSQKKQKKQKQQKKVAKKKASTKKRKLELDHDIPPPVPKYAVFREGEIVWLVIDKVLNNNTLAECNKILSINSQLKYWPAIVGSITPPDDNESYERVVYTVKPLILHENKNVTGDSLRPWLIYSPEQSQKGKNRFTRSLLNIDLDKATSEQIVEIYHKAVQKASEIVKVFTPVYQYDYHKVNKVKEIKEKHEGTYFKAMYFGAEYIYEGDLIRLTPSYGEDQNGLVDNGQSKETSYLQVTSIFEDSKGFQVTGDLYEKVKSLEKDKCELIPKNNIDEEYTINASDIASRFYSMYPDITEYITCEFLKTSENRISMLGEDVPPIISQTEEHLSVSIEEKTNTKVEIRIEDERGITATNETQDTKSIDKGGSHVKFSDIERRYAKKSDDIDLTPLVVSPDTPTFETDEDNSDVDVLNKSDVNNNDDSK